MPETRENKEPDELRHHRPSRELPAYRGVVMFEGKQFMWRQGRDKEIQVARNVGSQMGHYRSLGELGLNQDEEMKLVTDILKTYRLRAMPDGNHYFAAAGVVTKEGQLYISVNNERHIKDPFAGRGCGETSALRNSLESTHDPDVKFRSVYLMSGRASLTDMGELQDVKSGHVACMCGECRQNFREHSDADTRFVMLPTGVKAEDLKVNSTANTVAELGSNEAWLISHEKMYPHPRMLEVKKKGIADTVRKGVLSLIGHDDMPPLEVNLPKVEYDEHGFAKIHRDTLERMMHAAQRVDTKFPQLEVNDSLENINKAMLQLIQKAYREHAANVPDGKELKITAIIMRTDDGRFYPGIHVEGYGHGGKDWLPSEPQVFATGLSNGMNHIGWSNVYMMTFDTGQTHAEMSAAKGAAEESHSMPMAQPDWLNRLMKRMKVLDETQLTIIPVNDGTLPASKLQEYSETFDVRQAFGPDYANPKALISGVKQH